jgi:hypothetical protein
MPDAPAERAREIAAEALHCAMDRDMPGAAMHVGRLFGGPGLLVAIVGWIDTYLKRVYPEHVRGEVLKIVWYDANAEALETADEVSLSLRWAGRLIAARAANDEESFYAVLGSVPEGGEFGDGIMSLLNIVATGINDPELGRDAVAGAYGTGEGADGG